MVHLRSTASCAGSSIHGSDSQVNTKKPGVPTIGAWGRVAHPYLFCSHIITVDDVDFDLVGVTGTRGTLCPAGERKAKLSKGGPLGSHLMVVEAADGRQQGSAA